ncbi:MAG: acetoacetate--CoA ligase [Pseudomonadota bacterium]
MIGEPRPQNPVLWTPETEAAQATRMADFTRAAEAATGQDFRDYNDLWAWSVADIEGFWRLLVDHMEISLNWDGKTVIVDRRMPGATWFPGARLNYADAILRHRTRSGPAIIVRGENHREEIGWTAFADQVAQAAAALRGLGVGPGDRVCAILPNSIPAAVAMVASASVGAIWSLCAPDMGHVAILDRFRQIEPKVLIFQDTYRFAGEVIDRREVIETITRGLPSLSHKVRVSDDPRPSQGAINWADFLQAGAGATPAETQQVDFDHPLWVLYSSGTTGTPKPITLGHGGVTLEAAKQALHTDCRPGERFSWLTSSGWVMWNAQFAALGQGMTVVMVDGAPHTPDLGRIWRIAAEEKLHYLGAGAAFFTACMKAGVDPAAARPAALRSIGSTGSPLPADAYTWLYDALPGVWVAPISGGTDFAGAFVGGNPMLPVRAGEMQCRFLGNAVRAYDPEGQELIGAVGELVCTEPLPSMPLYFWGDKNGSRLHDAYFDTYPGVWRHGDWIEITPEGGAVIYGRSDATINRKGLRLGSSEIYSAVEALPEVLDSLVVDLEFLGRESFMPLFVVLAPGADVDTTATKINAAIAEAVSKRFLPSAIVPVPEVPRTLSGKKLEVPVKRLLLGQDPDKVVNRDSMANPESFDAFVAYARDRAAAAP